MIINKIIRIYSDILSFILIFIAPITKFILWFFIQMSFGLLLIPISAIWSFFYAILSGLSYLYISNSAISSIAGILGIPFAIVGDILVALLPSMGEEDSKRTKRLAVITFPYTYAVMQLNNSEKKGQIINNRDLIQKVIQVLYKERDSNPYMTTFIDLKYLNREKEKAETHF